MKCPQRMLLGQRLSALGISLEDVPHEQLQVATDASITLVDGPAALEEALTLLEEQFAVAMLALENLALSNHKVGEMAENHGSPHSSGL